METLQVPQGEFQLFRYPVRKQEKLRAWDAADEYLLNYLSEDASVEFILPLQTLVLNDSFGALSTALSTLKPYMQSDSCLAHKATLHNLNANKLNQESVNLLSSLEWPLREDKPLQLVLIKVPKTLALLEHQLHQLKPLIDQNTKIIAGGMAKHIHTSTLKLFEKILGPTKTSLAKKKARLIFCSPEKSNQGEIDTSPSPYPKHYILEGTDYTISNHANVFSRESLDIGTRFFLEHLPKHLGNKTILDLGCGNGIVGLLTAKQNSEAKIIFTDESFMAVDSAKANFTKAHPQQAADYFVDNCLDSIPTSSVDIILNNPPFHQGNAIGDHIAYQMFKDGKRVLSEHGEIWVVGNRHLNYHVKLKKLYGNCETVASNKKFVILRSIKKN